ncbi:ArnT family glycosyltransferase [Kocuria sp. CPCC 205300]|uniref:ArnT family glycosyltransferase n=1 Tax=Kocuria sabuli TaxID=3071448 RepID=UPI0036D8C72E
MSTSQIARPAEPPVPGRSEAPLFPDHVRTTASRWIEQLALPFLVLLQVLLSLRLSNTAFEDEALYVQAGRDLLEHWRTGAYVVELGSYFSGAPAAYPVLAGLLDEVGGLGLVRAFSLACIVVTMLCVRSITAQLFDRTAGDLAAFAFAVTGPVVLVSTLATFDALCLMLLAVALWLGLTRTSVASTLLAGLALAGAAVVKYTGAAFIPVVLGVALLAARRQTGRKALLRMGIAAVVTVTTLIALYALWGERVHKGIFFTTTGREALDAAPLSLLLDYVVKDIGLLLVLALLGGVFVTRSLRSTLFLLGLFAGGSGLVLSQMYLGEAVSFEKHMAYSALFLAPLAGRALAALAKPTMEVVLLAMLMGTLLVSGVTRSQAMYEWPNMERVLAEVEAQDLRPGQYFSTQSLTLGYYTKPDHPQVQWSGHYDLAAADLAAVEKAVNERTYEMIIVSADSSGNSRIGAQMEALREAALDSPHYELIAEPFPVEGWIDEDWYIFQLDR